MPHGAAAKERARTARKLRRQEAETPPQPTTQDAGRKCRHGQDRQTRGDAHAPKESATTEPLTPERETHRKKAAEPDEKQVVTAEAGQTDKDRLFADLQMVMDGMATEPRWRGATTDKQGYESEVQLRYRKLEKSRQLRTMRRQNRRLKYQE